MAAPPLVPNVKVIVADAPDKTWPTAKRDDVEDAPPVLFAIQTIPVPDTKGLAALLVSEAPATTMIFPAVGVEPRVIDSVVAATLFEAVPD